jgi:VWFA-related protein
MFIPGLHQENFKVMEDGVPQRVVHFAQTEKPITAVLLVEFANMPYPFLVDMLNAAYSFTQTLKKDDYIAVSAFDMRPRIIVDFTQDKNAIQGALNQLRIPGFSETNVFDALYDTIDRLEGVEGHKYIILLTRGIDTFSKINFDKISKKLQGTKDVTIYAVSTGQAFRLWLESHGAFNGPWGSAREMDYLQADNQLRNFSQWTGGKAYFPRFEAEFPEIFGDIASTIRNQYTISYHPTNSKLDGTYRKLKVALVAQDGEPLKIVDQKGKEVKVAVITRDGYRAAHSVE